MRLLLLPVLALTSGCATLGWYGQAARGQAELLLARKDIEKVLASPDLAPDMRAGLEQVGRIRAFAERELALPAEGSYESWVELDRDAVVYNVIATPEFSVVPRTWCYPIAGCVAYRGFFRRDAAERRARRLAERGFDVQIAPAVAYSTLGRFDDPVTSPMLARGELALAGLLFHELAHQRLYVPGDTAFSESYATAVEREGVRRWLRSTQRLDRLRRWEANLSLERAFIELLLEARENLKRLYARALEPQAMRAAKRERFAALQARYLRFRREHDSDAFDAFMNRPLNNAHLALVATYEAGTDAFGDLLAEYDGNFRRFHEAVERLASADSDTRAEFLNRCRTRICP
jgi:predicted aminopeptidase